MKKKLIFFIGGLNFGGMERVVFIAEQLLRNKFDTYIVTLYQTNSDYKDLTAKIYDLDVPPANGKLGKVIGFVKRLIRTKKMKKELQPDVVFSFGMYSNYLNALSKKNEKIVMGIRSYDWLTRPFVTKKTDEKIVKKFDSINAVSKLISHDAIKLWNLGKKEISTIYNPYNIELIEKKSIESVEDFEFENGIFYFITMGRLADQKGFNHLIRAFYEIYKKFEDVRLIIMGDGNRKKDIEHLISQYKLENIVCLIGGKSNPYKYIRQSNCYVLSSHSEGFPNALVEAMCVGKITISSNCPSGPSEIYLNKILCDIDKSEFVVTDYGILTPCFQYDNSYERKTLQQEEVTYAQAMEYVYQNYSKLIYIGTKAQERVTDFGYEPFEKALISEIDATLKN